MCVGGGEVKNSKLECPANHNCELSLTTYDFMFECVLLVLVRLNEETMFIVNVAQVFRPSLQFFISAIVFIFI